VSTRYQAKWTLSTNFAMSLPPSSPPPRSTYRHGDLRRALLEAGIALARDGGPDAIVLREATRRAGVVPNAAYRHFANRDDLLHAVRSAALAMLAGAIEAELAQLRRRRDAGQAARDRLRAIGSAYVRFAQAEPGLFRTAFVASDRPPTEPDPAMAGTSGLNPFELLGSVLDEMVAAGVMPAARRPGAEYLAWSSVHGLSMLLIDGPLRTMAAAERAQVAEALLGMVERGLA
jgi:AcrR family transcriptional regulator